MPGLVSRRSQLAFPRPHCRQLFASEVCGGARGFINGIGNLGGLVGPFLVGWVISNFGSTEYGIYVLSGFLTLAFLTALTFPRHLVYDQSQSVRQLRARPYTKYQAPEALTRGPQERAFREAVHIGLKMTNRGGPASADRP